MVTIRGDHTKHPARPDSVNPIYVVIIPFLTLLSAPLWEHTSQNPECKDDPLYVGFSQFQNIISHDKLAENPHPSVHRHSEDNQDGMAVYFLHQNEDPLLLWHNYSLAGLVWLMIFASTQLSIVLLQLVTMAI